MKKFILLWALLFLSLTGCSTNRALIVPVELQEGWIGDDTFEKVVYFATTRVDKCSGKEESMCGADRFETGNNKTEKIQYGEVKVRIPYLKKIGGIDGMTLEPTIALMKWDEINKQISDKDILVFVHGFNTSFKEAAIRTAQLSFDLNFNGEAVFFSWPADTKAEYLKDHRRADENVENLVEFLTKVAGTTDKRIHIIAHSLGTNILTKALSTIDTNMKKDKTLLGNRRGRKIFNTVVLAAGDFPQDRFTAMFKDNHFKDLADRYTLYSSYNDIPLRLSKTINKYFEKDGTPRIGDSHNAFFVIDGVDTIDAREEVSMQVFGHSYYANYSPLIYDLNLLLRGIPPNDRLLIQVIDKNKQELWFIRPDKTVRPPQKSRNES